MPAKKGGRKQKRRARASARVSKSLSLNVPTTWKGITDEFSTISLDHLLSLSALLSADDALGGRHWSEFNTFEQLHPVLIQNFTRAIIASEANHKVIAVPSVDYFLSTLIEGVGSLQNHPNIRDIPTMDIPTLTSDVISLMWRQQARVDARSIVSTDIGRAYATLVHFPKQLEAQIKAKQKSGYINLDSYFKEKYGCRIETVLQGLMLIYFWYKNKFNSNKVFNPYWLQVLRPNGGKMDVGQHNLEKYIHEARPYLNELAFTEQEIIKYLDKWLPAEEIPYLLDLISANIEQLRELLEQSPFSSGIEAFAPLPFEIKPLLRLSDGRYLIPNLRSFLTGMARLPLTLLATDTNPNVMTCYGQGLEGYAVEATLSCTLGTDITAIPEHRYKRAGEKLQIESADVTLLEPRKRPVLIEVKAKRLPDYGLALPGSTAFRTLDDLITKTVISGVKKSKDLRTSWPSSYSGVLSAASNEPALVVVVYGENVPNFDGILRNLIDAKHPIYPYLGRFLPLSIDEYEHHLDIAKERGESVIDLLQQSAEEFRERHPLQMTNHTHLGNTRPKNPFVNKYMTDLLKLLSASADSRSFSP